MMDKPASPEALLPPSSTESFGLRKAWNALHDLYQSARIGTDLLSVEALIAEQRAVFWDVVRQGVRRQPGAERAITDYAQLMDYLWYAKQDAPAPATVVKDADGDLRVDQSRLGQTTFMRVRDTLWSLGLDAVASPSHTETETPDAEVFKPVCLELLHETPAYQLLSSFGAEVPPAEERPLTLSQKSTALAHVRAQANRQYPLASNAERDRIARRQVAAIELMTMPPARAPISQDNGFERARRFIMTRIITFAQKRGMGEVYAVYPEAGTTDIRLCINDARVYALKHVFSDYFANTRSGMHIVSDELLGAVLVDIIGNHYEPRENYLTWLEDRVKAKSETLADTFSSHNPAVYVSDAEYVLNSLKRPTGELPVAKQEVRELPSGFPGYGIAFHSREDLRNLESMPTGYVIKALYDDDTERMVLSVPAPPEGVPLLEYSKAELILRVEGEINQDIVIKVPGYRMIGRDVEGGAYGFVRDTGNDPQARCETTLEPWQRDRVIAFADEAGVFGLADRLREYQNITVSGLMDFIQAESTYFMPEGYMQLRVPTSARDLKELVSPDIHKFEVQCTGSAAICRLFIDEAELGNAGSEVGHIFRTRAGEKISYVLHERVPFVDAKTGLLYVFDTTPSSDSESGVVNNHRYAGRRAGDILRTMRETSVAKAVHLLGKIASSSQGLRKRNTVHEKVMRAPVPSEPKPPIEEPKVAVRTETDVQEELAYVYRGLMQNLGRVLGARDIPLPEFMVLSDLRGRPATDLMRLAVEVLGQSVPYSSVLPVSARQTNGRARNLLKYIEDLRTGSGNVRDPHGYAVRMVVLEMLERSLKAAADLTADAELE